jgi:glycosyltransferase involved in cell wall biosynthesis
MYLLDAFTGLKKDGFPHRLIIIGEKSDFRTSDATIDRLISETDRSAVEFSGYLDDEKLKELLARAALLVQPSLYEGFGLPPLEAMLLGTKALISDIPVFKEIYGDFPVEYFKSGDAVDLKQKMKNLLTDHDACTRGFPLSSELISKYSFEKTASTILKELSTPS